MQLFTPNNVKRRHECIKIYVFMYVQRGLQRPNRPIKSHGKPSDQRRHLQQTTK